MTITYMPADSEATASADVDGAANTDIIGYQARETKPPYEQHHEQVPH